MGFDHCVAACLVPLAFWILLSGLDDLWIALVLVCTRRSRLRRPEEAELDRVPERQIAIFVPLWREHRVIGQMLAHNLAGIRYSNYQFFVGVYPNDPATARAVAEVAQRDGRVHLCLCSHDGPTSKGDCLNEIYRSMVESEIRGGCRFEIITTHDAEDLVHPQSLRLINFYSRHYAMVQMPVLPLPTGPAELTHSLYCDEFAEFQTKDIPVRQRLGGFLPANGVGTGFERSALERLGGDRGCIFDPECLTEDYENGYRLHALGYRQAFVPIRFENGQPVATREYFPRTLRPAVRQRSRWVAGIVLQGWQYHGWRGPWRQVYWFWRDRKGLVGNLLSPFANLIFFSVAADSLWSAATGRLRRFAGPVPVWALRMCLATYWISIVQVAIRAAASLEAIPPLPTAEPGPPATSSKAASTATTCSTSVASANRLGSASNRPSVSVSRTRHSAPTRLAMSAARRSLSPKRISSSATASFSLMTGTAPSSMSRVIVSRAWRYCRRAPKSENDSSTWATNRPSAAKASS